jgi:hypothetical protein
MVTHTVTTDAQFDGYELSTMGHGAELFWKGWS